eukprot:365157-Chlamydomonas_euryale.AAC.1
MRGEARAGTALAGNESAGREHADNHVRDVRVLVERASPPVLGAMLAAIVKQQSISVGQRAAQPGQPAMELHTRLAAFL